MLIILLIILACIWLPILLYQLVQRPFRLLLVWLFIAPVVTNLVITYGGISQQEASETGAKRFSFYTTPSTLKIDFLLEPTRLLFALWFGVYLLRARQQQKHLVPLNRTEIWMGLFSLLLLASVCLKSWRFAFGLRTAVDAFIVPFLGYYLARRLFTSEARLRQLTRVLTYMGCYVIVIAMIERLTHYSQLLYRINGPFESGNTLHVVMAVVFFIVLSDSVKQRALPKGEEAVPRHVRVFILFVAPLIIILTLVRGNWVGFLMGSVVFLFLGRHMLTRKIGLLGMALMFVPVGIVCISLLVPQELLEKRAGDTGNVYGRFVTWQATIRQWDKAPLVGIGLNNLHGALSENKLRIGQMENYSTPHNSFLSFLSELGAVGLLVYLALTKSILQMGLELYRKEANVHDCWRGIAVISVMFAYQVPSLFATTFYTPSPMHVYVYTWLGALAGRYRFPPSTSQRYTGVHYTPRMNQDRLAIEP